MTNKTKNFFIVKTKLQKHQDAYDEQHKSQSVNEGKTDIVRRRRKVIVSPLKLTN